MPLLPVNKSSECARHLGCFRENSMPARLMPEERNYWPSTLTPELCINHCKEKGYSYAGLQVGTECFCSNERPSYKSLVEISDCKTTCSGDGSKLCGSNWRINVYDIRDEKVNYVQKNYLGCYEDALKRTFKKMISTNLNTPEFCSGYCYRFGYRYSGVQNSDQCYCGDEMNGPIASEEECNMDCSGNSCLLCGGSTHIGIYHTSLSGEREDARLVGCFVDSSPSLLSGHQVKLQETNSPLACLNVCGQLGFRFAGVREGVACLCGDSWPDKSKLTYENDCFLTCPGNKLKKCGGQERIHVYVLREPELSWTQ